MDISFEDELSCPICYVTYQDKVKPTLICNNSHIICDPCLWKMYIDLNAKIACPFCKLEMENKGTSVTHLEKAKKMKMEQSAKKKEAEEKEIEAQREKAREKESEKQMQKEFQRLRLTNQKDRQQEIGQIVKNRPVQLVVRQELQMQAVPKAEKEQELKQINAINRQFEERARFVQTKPISSTFIPSHPQINFFFASPSPNNPPYSNPKPMQNKPNHSLP